MYQVSTVNLSPDAGQADVSFGATDGRELDANELIALLERFAALDAAQNQTADPHIVVTGRAGKFHVRTGQGKLFLYNARATVEPYAELTAPEIVAQLERADVTTAPFSPAGEPAATTHPTSASHRAIAAAILFAGLGLNGFTLYSVFYTERIDDRPAVILVTDAAESSNRRREIAGTYATGARPGDRQIVVRENGRVEFSEIGATGGINSNQDNFQLGKHGAKFCLTTIDSGVIDVLNLETLVYYRDTYRRR